MSGMHHHAHGQRHDQTGQANRKNLWIALIIIGAWMFVELIGALWTGSLALLADAAHMFSDFFNLLISLIAILLAAKAATKRRTFGNHRYEILAALFNSVALLVMSVFIIIEAWKRLLQPQEVMGGTMMIIALIGLVANLGAMFALMRGEVKENLNMRGAFLHVVGDTLGSVAAIIAGLLIFFFNWYLADPILSMLIAVLILFTGAHLLKDSVHVLMEGTPKHVDPTKVRQSLLAIEGVVNVHDLHVWTITSGIDSLTCHLVIDPAYAEQQHDILVQANRWIREHLHIKHSTIQIETEDLQHLEHPYI